MRIKLNKNKFALVDKSDFQSLSKHRWCLHTSRGREYAAYWIEGNRRVLMHRFILGTPLKRLEIDHINGNGLDNRRKNLRFCTHSENMLNMNRGKHKGVFWIPKLKKWRARIQIDGKKIHLGVFNRIQDAILAYHNFRPE